VRDSLARLIGRSPTDDAQLRAMRAAAWHKQGVPVLPLHEIRNEVDRLYVIQIAERLYGKRDAIGPDQERQNGKRA
jgi:hypothetical protein